MRVVSQRLPDGRRIVGGATPYADAELLEEIRDVALAGWVVMLLVGVPAAWIEVRRVLARVDRLSDVAATISADALARRLPQRRGDHGGDEIDRLAATLNALLDRAGGAVEQLRTLADAMAHDLRTPLAAIRGTLENAVTVDGDGARRAAVEAAIAEVDDLAALVSATLDTAEAEAGALPLRREPSSTSPSWSVTWRSCTSRRPPSTGSIWWLMSAVRSRSRPTRRCSNACS